MLDVVVFLFPLVLLLYLLKLRVHLGEDRLDRSDGMLLLLLTAVLCAMTAVLFTRWLVFTAVLWVVTAVFVFFTGVSVVGWSFCPWFTAVNAVSHPFSAVVSLIAGLEADLPRFSSFFPVKFSVP